MIESDLRRELEFVGRRVRLLRFWSGLSLCWLVLAAVGGFALWWAAQQSNTVPGVAIVALATSAVLAFVGCLLISRRAARNEGAIARSIEAHYPDLDWRLLAALEQRREQPETPLGFLQATVIREAMIHARGHDWGRVVPAGRLWLARLSHAALLMALVAVFVGLLRNTPPRTNEREFWLGKRVDPTPQFQIEIEPEDTELERGTSLLALARFTGPLPADVDLLYKTGDDEPQQLRMSKSLDDPLFAGRVAAVEADLTYSIRYGDAQTRWYKVGVFDYPDLMRADARLVFPEYTGQSPAVVEDTRSVTAVEGTRLTWICQLNKPVAEALLVPAKIKGEDAAPAALALAPDKADASVYTVALELKQSRRYRLHLKDREGRANKQPPELVVNVTPNKPPELKLASPSKDVQVSPLEELSLTAEVRDDFGLRRYGVSYSMAGQPPKEMVLGENVAGRQKQAAQHLIAFESLQAEPDQLLSYYFWAEDSAADGTPRRTSGDMFFAEVRPFEEIFRQGEQPTEEEQQQQQQQQQANQNAQKAEKLAELQKQIINATWKIIRREVSAQPTAQFAPDAKLLGESQADARKQAEALGEDLTDPRSQAFLETVLKHMDQALAELKQAGDGPKIDALQPALAAEQAAYQALLKLRAREHSVVRNRRQQGGGGGGGGQNRSQQQLNQLELANNENRYEQQRTAASQQEAQQRETRQVLNRLRELAQRQEDLNKQVKELQNALEAAKDEAQREEIQRQLARLRDQQQQMLRDTDELRDRMDSQENQERMAESRQQLEQTRNNIRRASEALEQGMVSQAAAAGERAADELNNLRDDFRQQTAGQFTEAMNQMRDDARKLDENEQDLSKRMEQLGKEQQRSLRDTGDRQQINEGLEQQKHDLNKLVDQMRQTVEQAETSEPLLSKQLYETVRETTHEQKPDRALDTTRQLLERGFIDEARLTEQDARRGITRLREGVEKAAESVLGDEGEALRRARNELDSLAEEINREMRQRNGGQEGQPQEGQQQPQTGEGQPGQSGQPGQPGENQVAGNEPREGQRQEGSQNRPRNSTGEQPQPGQQGQQGQQPGQQGQQGQQQGQQGQQQGQQGQQQGQGQQGQQQGGRQQSGQRGGGNQRAGGERDELQRLAGGATGPGGERRSSPLTGEGFREWSDRLRDVEEMVSDPELRAEAARIRDAARSIRAEFKRHSEDPNWELVQEFIGRPLVELRDKVAEELLRQESSEALVPIDREPVPPKYSDAVRRYYERLGSGK